MEDVFAAALREIVDEALAKMTGEDATYSEVEALLVAAVEAAYNIGTAR